VYGFFILKNAMNNTILFICTGNYYRSRFAEILFNYLAEQHQLGFKAYSKGLKLWDGNVGPLSKHTIGYMQAIGVDVNAHLRFPVPVEEIDFLTNNRIIAMDEKEHRNLMAQLFPAYEQTIEYWGFADDYIEDPNKVLPLLEKKITDFVMALKNA